MEDKIIATEINVYDKEEIYTNCIVQVWTNTVTGEVSIGWKKTEDTIEISSDEDNNLLS